MTSTLVARPDIQAFLDRIAGLDDEGGDARTKAIVRRIVSDLFATIDDFDVNEDEFWKAINFLASAAPEFGLWAAGLGFEHYLDIRMDIADQQAGIEGGTPRTIEGPLYVAGAPRSTGFARLDDGADTGETLVMKGRVLDQDGKAVAGAIVDVWHANTLGNYSYFDPTQTAFNLRRQIETDADGAYKFRSILPSGYAVPAGGTTERLLDTLGRHGNRPAHIHFFVSAPGHRHLTTQVNIAGDAYLHDDFAYATRDELIPPTARREAPDAIHAEGLNAPFTEILFDFTLLATPDEEQQEASERARVELAA
jgi:catechol 1,2-dioxygenase